MKNLSNYKSKSKKAAVAIGTFDGVHKGHVSLIEKSICEARKNALRSVVVAFEKPFKKTGGIISTCEEKTALLSACGVDEIYIIAEKSPILSFEREEFFDFLKNEIAAARVICGKDFAFGKDRKGTFGWLSKKGKETGVEIIEAKPLKIFSKKVSSSRIRELLAKSDIKKAERLLGRKYSFQGTPFREKGLASKLGFPTINLKIEESKILPRGVFISLCAQGEKLFPSITNIGTRPTANRGGKIAAETHLLNFNGKWNKKTTETILLKKIRDEKKFANLSALQKQISKDAITAKNAFALK